MCVYFHQTGAKNIRTRTQDVGSLPGKNLSLSLSLSLSLRGKPFRKFPSLKLRIGHCEALDP
jgi:hypothetical protein